MWAVAPSTYLGLALIPAWISSYIHYNVSDEITYPFLNFNGPKGHAFVLITLGIYKQYYNQNMYIDKCVYVSVTCTTYNYA